MRVACVAFTRRGLELARTIAAARARLGDDVRLSAPERLCEAPDVTPTGGLHGWTQEAFAWADALVFVSACGIAVRAVAPFLHDKLEDPAVVCVDERGSFAVPLASGHVGGANELARSVAAACGGQAVVTTATDVNDVFAVDVWARRHDLAILDRDEVRQVSARLLEGGRVGLASDLAIAGEPPEGLTWDEDGTSELGVSVSVFAGRRPFAHTLRLVPRVVTVGVGCRRGVPSEDILSLVDRSLVQAGVAPQAVRAVATIDVKADEDGLLRAARERGWALRLHTAAELAAVPGDFSSSDFVLRTVGVGNVCERAACAGGEALLAGRVSDKGVTVALGVASLRLSFADGDDAEGDGPAAGEPAPGRVSEGPAPADPAPADPARATRVLKCVGIGPGGREGMTLRAKAALAWAEVVVGYTTYVRLIAKDCPQARLVSTPMRSEVRRCTEALERAAAGQRVVVVCSGDPGVYGMAGLLLELAGSYPGVRVEVVPGVTAANGGAAVLGAPLMHDWCAISLSDLMTPWEVIARRLVAAARADFCICLYNPSSRGRADHLRRACDVLLTHRDANTVCGVVRNVEREGESCRVLTLGRLRDEAVDMVSCVYVGNSQTREVGGRMVTPRGYCGGEA